MELNPSNWGSETAQCPACLRTGRFWTIQTHAVACIERHSRFNAQLTRAGDVATPTSGRHADIAEKGLKVLELRQSLPSTPPPVVVTSGMSSPEPKQQRTRSRTESSPMSPRHTSSSSPSKSQSPPVSVATAQAAFAQAALVELLRAVDEHVEESQESYFWEMMTDHMRSYSRDPTAWSTPKATKERWLDALKTNSAAPDSSASNVQKTRHSRRTGNAKRTPDMVACPGCTQLVPARQIHAHLDACLNIEELDGPSASIKNARKRKRVQSREGRRAPAPRTLLITPPRRTKPRPRFKVASKMFRFDVMEDMAAFTSSIPDYLRYRSGFPSPPGAIDHPAFTGPSPGHGRVAIATADSMAALIQSHGEG